MSDQNEPPKRHVRMRQGRAKKEEAQAPHDNIQDRRDLALAEEAIQQYAEEQLSRPHEQPITQVNTVIQAIKGDNYGRLGIVGRIDPDRYKCYIITRGGGRDYFDVLPDEFAVIGKAKKAIKDPIPDHLPSGPETPNINADTSPFGGIK